MNLLHFVGALIALPCMAAEFRVKYLSELRRFEKDAEPGDEIVLSGENWRDVSVELDLNGTAEAPILVRSEVSFTGQSSLSLKGSHVVLDGFRFENGHLSSGHVIRLRGSHCRLTRCTIDNYNPDKATTRYHWVSVYGHHNRVDHCRFEGQNHSGCTLVVWLTDEGENGHHRVDQNHFLNRSPGNGNGFETIRIGTSATSMTEAHCMVTHNLFENCDGEIELISNKSCKNTWVANTIVRCEGALTLRHGNDCVVMSNLILGDEKKGTGGIRIVGEGHRIIGNYIEGVNDRIGGAIALSAGVREPELNQHAQVRNVFLDENTLIANKGEEIVVGHGKGSHERELMPEDVTISNTQNSGGPVMHRLLPTDVGPDSVLSPHPDAITNSHAVGEVDHLQLTSRIVPHPDSIEGIVIDETEAELEGNWQYSTHTPPWVGIGYLHDQKSGKGRSSAKFHFEVPESGDWEVQVSHCANVRRATNTPVTVHYAEGEETLRINQQKTPWVRGLFRTIGKFRFEAGEPAWVRISNEGTDGKYVIVDALRLVRAEE